MFIVGILLITGGYTLTYYGVSMWKHYTNADTEVAPPGTHAGASTNPDGIPLGILLGLQKPTSLSNTSKIPVVAPPFNLGGSIYGQTAHTTALNKNNPPTFGSGGIVT